MSYVVAVLRLAGLQLLANAIAKTAYQALTELGYEVGFGAV